MQKALHKIYGIIETGLLLLVGAFALYLSLSTKYGLLMNENFRWLTFAGALLILIIGLASASKLPKGSLSNVLFFLLLLFIVLIGKPYLPNANTIDPSEQFMSAGLWDQIDQTRFPKEELRNLSTLQADAFFESGASFTTVGVVKRLDELDGQKSFALMSTFMYCCVADMFGTGFRVPSDMFDELEDGQMLMISGKLADETQAIALPNFRFGRAMISSVNKDYYLKVDSIMAYSRLDQLPLLSEIILEGEKIQVFKNALMKSGLIDELSGQDAYTLFVPVDKALEDLDVPLDELSRRKLKKFINAHIVKGKLFSDDLANYKQVKTLGGDELTINFKCAKHTINNSRVLFEDTEAQNGIIHFIYPAITDPNE
ncbi:fasciclin domain-containing protein [Carboxylicivirga sp. M1479]|uniref:fasciclin domain-containing protein n=1 Tax=Carboxylicivirga sp. M1479 TaxID=2594476 RepID=UPI00117793E2|nr:fasciclin domain-containing protein [Carboxylicivirga sp. M1479]TRX70243.1 fasciclin domain-containing protein [Carboxylicivirga sp. M1479]